MTRVVFAGNSILAYPYGQLRAMVADHFGWQIVDTAPPDLPAALPGDYLQPLNALALSQTWQGRIATLCPDRIVVVCSENDAIYAQAYAGNPAATTPATWRAAVSGLLTGLVALPQHPRVAFVGVMPLQPVALPGPLPAWATDWRNVLEQMDAIAVEECQRAGAIFVPVRATLPANLISADGIHPTADVGQAWLAQRIIDVLTEAGA